MNPAQLLNPRAFKKTNGTAPRLAPSSSASSSSMTSTPSPPPLSHRSMHLSSTTAADEGNFFDPLGTLAMTDAAQPDSLLHASSMPTTSMSSFQTSFLDPQQLTSEGQDSSRASPNAQSSAPQFQGATPPFDPRSLLNPKASAKRSRDEDGVVDRGTSGSSEDGPGLGSMIERMHGIQRREDQPAKKVKSEHKTEADEPHRHKATFEGSGKGTVLGEYVADQRKQDDKEAGPPASNAVVDLTLDDDDDDVVVVGDSGGQEVCLGSVENAFVNYYQFPAQKSGVFQGSSSMWPQFKVELRRRPGTHDYNIAAVDPSGKEFGKLDIRLAMALAPLMEAVATLRMRTECRIEPRRRRPGEAPGAPASARLNLTIHIFAPKKSAKHIGQVLSQKQVWLRDPTIPLKGIPYDNPQAVSVKAPRANTSNQSSYGFVARTVEEIRSDVINMFDSLAKSEEIPEMEQNDMIITPLLAHQKQALHFMTSREADEDDAKGDKESNTLWKPKMRGNGQRYYYNIITGQESRVKPAPVRGGILADAMGLGKTLSILSVIATTKAEALAFSRKSPAQTTSAPLIRCNSKATLLVCPVSTVANWEEQINAHVMDGALSYYIYHGPSRTTDVNELARNDVVITTYSVISSEHDKPKKKPLALINWFRIVLDEAHMIRSQSTKQSISTCALLAQHRWAVTGTPVQNRLDDLGALIKFLRIKPFDEKGGFTQYILAPFKNADPEILPKLRVLVDSITLRRLKDRIDLPPRNDRLVRLDFSAEEHKLYDFFAKDTAARVAAIASGRDKLAKNHMGHILRAMGRLRMICAHGSELLGDEDMKLTEGLSYGNAIEVGDDDDEEEKPAITQKQAYDMLHLLRESDMNHCGICDRTIGDTTLAADSDDEADSKKDRIIGFMTPCYQIVCPGCLDEFKERMKKRATPGFFMTCPLCDSYVRQSLFVLNQDEADKDEAARLRVRENPRLAKQLGRYGGPHTKVKALIDSLLESKRWSDAHPDEAPLKSVVFSGWTSYLDLISIAFEDHNLVYTRLDGTMSRNKRTAALDCFRDDPKVHIILVSINAGGLGLNLTSASKAYVMEPQYNPAAEAQAVDRVHRLGQKREVTITRFVMNNSFEEKMLELQNKKKDLADLSMNRNARIDKEEAARRRLEDLRSLFR